MTTQLDERLRLAREALSLTQTEAASRAGLGSASAISEFESGKRQPSLLQLEALSKAYGKSLGWFLDETPQLVRDVVLWRQRPAANTAGLIEADFLRLCEQYRDLENWCGEVVPCALPSTAVRVPSEFNYSDAEALAHQVRNELCLGERPGSSLLRTLEEVRGVKVFHLSMAVSGVAACSMSDKFGAAVLLHVEHVPWRKNFDLAHELFHLVTWNLFGATWSGEPKLASEKEEKLASCFARHLLMPVEVFKIAVAQRKKGKEQLGPEDFDAIARQFDVSVDAVLWHMAFVENRSEADTRRDIDAYRLMQVWLEARERTEEPSRPRRFEALARAALKRGEISIGRFSEYMGISRTQGMRIAEEQSRDASSQEDQATPL